MFSQENTYLRLHTPTAMCIPGELCGSLVVWNPLRPFVDYGNFSQYEAVTRHSCCYFVHSPDFVDEDTEALEDYASTNCWLKGAPFT